MDREVLLFLWKNDDKAGSIEVMSEQFVTWVVVYVLYKCIPLHDVSNAF